MRRSQRDQIRDLLRVRGDRGVSAHEAVYEMGITRMAAIVHDLRTEEKMNISTIDEGRTPDGRRKLVRYVLKPWYPCGTCGHEARVHPKECGVVGCVCQGWSR